MKHPLLWLLTTAVIAFIIAGFIFLDTASSYSTFVAQRTPALVSGITCLVIATGLLVLGIFKFGNRD